MGLVLTVTAVREGCWGGFGSLWTFSFERVRSTGSAYTLRGQVSPALSPGGRLGLWTFPAHLLGTVAALNPTPPCPWGLFPAPSECSVAGGRAVGRGGDVRLAEIRPKRRGAWRGGTGRNQTRNAVLTCCLLTSCGWGEPLPIRKAAATVRLFGTAARAGPRVHLPSRARLGLPRGTARASRPPASDAVGAGSRRSPASCPFCIRRAFLHS